MTTWQQEAETYPSLVKYTTDLKVAELPSEKPTQRRCFAADAVKPAQR